MISQLHILATYSCTKECDHCFVYSGPGADPTGTFSLEQLIAVIEEAKKVDSIEWFYFEGGEPFLFYPIMVDAIRLAKKNNFKVGIVTNGYWATSEDNARYFLKDLRDLEIDDLSVSDDCFHMLSPSDHPSILIEKIGSELGVPVNTLCLYKPDEIPNDIEINKGEPITGGNIRIRGRAADTLSSYLPTKESIFLNSCGYEDLVNPMRVHLDAYGYIHICQGITIGNMWEKPLSEILTTYDPYNHPIVAPLVKGGPLELAKTYQIPFKEQFVETCHMCYTIRKTLRAYHPEYLQPNQIYNEQ